MNRRIRTPTEVPPFARRGLAICGWNKTGALSFARRRLDSTSGRAKDLASTEVRVLSKIAEGNYGGTGTGGLARLKAPRVETLTGAHGLTDGRVLALREKRAGLVVDWTTGMWLRKADRVPALPRH